MKTDQAVRALPGFESLETLHCITGSMRHIYVYNQHPLSEEMLLGIGGGVGFIYWHSKGEAPFIGGRAKGSPGQGFEKCVGARTGVAIEEFTTSSTRKAQNTMLEMLAQGQPVMVYLDMGMLPYFDFGGTEYHFGGHAVVVCGYDSANQTVLLADRDETLPPVSLHVLMQARGSTYKPFPPKNRWFTMDFTDKRSPTPTEMKAAIQEQTASALHPPISNMGVKGIRKAGKAIVQWPQMMDEDLLQFSMFNTYIFIDSEGGTGGGIFRYMFARFLQECAVPLNLPALNEIAGQFHQIGDAWQEAAEMFKSGSQPNQAEKALPAAARQLEQIAEMEQAAWEALETAVGDDINETEGKE